MLLFQFAPGMTFSGIDGITTDIPNAGYYGARLERYLRLLSHIVQDPSRHIYDPNTRPTEHQNWYIEHGRDPRDPLTHEGVTGAIRGMVVAAGHQAAADSIPSLLFTWEEARAAVNLLRKRPDTVRSVVGDPSVHDNLEGVRRAVGRARWLAGERTPDPKLDALFGGSTAPRPGHRVRDNPLDRALRKYGYRTRSDRLPSQRRAAPRRTEAAGPSEPPEEVGEAVALRARQILADLAGDCAGDLVAQSATVATPEGAARAWRFWPRGDAATRGPAVVLLPGLRPQGPRDPAVARFGRALARAGLRVLAPEIPALMGCRFDPGAVEIIGSAVDHLAEETGQPVGLIGLSFGGGLALLVAGNPRYRHQVAYVVTVGAHDDLGRVARYCLTHRAEGPEGVEDRWADPKGLRVLLCALADRLFAPEDLDAAREVLARALAEDDDGAGRTLERLSESTRAKVQAALSPQFSEAQSELAGALGVELEAAEVAEALAAASPAGRCGAIEAPVYLLHGADDRLIPPSESAWISRELPPGRVRAHLVTPALGHADLADAAPGDTEAVVAFLENVLAQAQASAVENGAPPMNSYDPLDSAETGAPPAAAFNAGSLICLWDRDGKRWEDMARTGPGKRGALLAKDIADELLDKLVQLYPGDAFVQVLNLDPQNLGVHCCMAGREAPPFFQWFPAGTKLSWLASAREAPGPRPGGLAADPTLFAGGKTVALYDRVGQRWEDLVETRPRGRWDFGTEIGQRLAVDHARRANIAALVRVEQPDGVTLIACEPGHAPRSQWFPAGTKPTWIDLL
jgi:pimeloyl-ACP methyl ester carboxylesterase